MKERIVHDISIPHPSATPSDSSTTLLEPPQENTSTSKPALRRTRGAAQATTVRHFATIPAEEHAANRQAELFYLQKQIQLQTNMIFILEDGSRIQGIIEWYDRNCIKVRGKSRMLIYKTAIKYLYKAGEIGSAPGE